MNRSLKKIPLAALCAAMAAACAGGATDATITVDASKVEGSVTPWLYGACIEDVNHEIYGGLYDQRIFGESFEEPVPNIRTIVDEEFEKIWSGKATAKEALDAVVRRGNEQLVRFERVTK